MSLRKLVVVARAAFCVWISGTFLGHTPQSSGGSRGGWGDASPPPAVRHIGIFVGDV